MKDKLARKAIKEIVEGIGGEVSFDKKWTDGKITGCINCRSHIHSLFVRLNDLYTYLGVTHITITEHTKVKKVKCG